MILVQFVGDFYREPSQYVSPTALLRIAIAVLGTRATDKLVETAIWQSPLILPGVHALTNCRQAPSIRAQSRGGDQ